MPETNFEQALEVFRSLPLPEQQKLWVWLEEQAQRQKRRQAEAEHEKENYQQIKDWLKANSTKYQGQWIALDGSRLLSHGTDSKSVYEQARKQGTIAPFMKFITTEEDLPFGGW